VRNAWSKRAFIKLDLHRSTADGVVVNYPGFVWGDQIAADNCDELYDSRLRPWQMTAATGPKNIVLILDVSGSMAISDRIGAMKRAAKKVIDSATHADYLGVVIFNEGATTYQGLTTMVGRCRLKIGFQMQFVPLRHGGVRAHRRLARQQLRRCVPHDVRFRHRRGGG
jgi:hypothetical protein